MAISRVVVPALTGRSSRRPFERGRVGVLLLLAGLLADAIGPVIAGLLAVPGQRRQSEHDVAGWDDAVEKLRQFGQGIGAGGNDHVLDVLHAGDVVEITAIRCAGHLVSR